MSFITDFLVWALVICLAMVFFGIGISYLPENLKKFLLDCLKVLKRKVFKNKEVKKK